MDNIQLIGVLATIISLVRLLIYYYKLHRSDEKELPSLNYVLLGMSTAVLWLIHHYYRGSRLSVVYISIFLTLESYILLRVLKLKYNKTRND